jgi:hypothetical protein
MGGHEAQMKPVCGFVERKHKMQGRFGIMEELYM